MSAAAWHDQDPAGIEATAELRGETLVWQMLLHQARANLGNLAAWPHDQLRRKSLDVAADLIYIAEQLLTALDDVLDPKAGDQGHSLSVRALTNRLDTAQRALRTVQ
ncbi:MAG: hypothetical protein J0H43_00010 [Actinobacteria bacterium]|nr:hypothetical protein [Actinomycetota bacterium]